MSRNLIFIIGTRAQLIKVAPVVAACERRDLACTLLMTGQHQETIQDLLDEFDIHAPQLSAVPSSEHATMVSLLRWLPAAYRGVKAKLRTLTSKTIDVDVLVHGDTLSTVLGAAAARRLCLRVVHLESGLTSGKLFHPFPEELFRRVVFRLTQVAMCPSAHEADYMRAHHPRCKVIDTHGNTIVDAAALTGAADAPRNQKPDYFVASLHRFQNIYVGARLRFLVDLLEVLAAKYPIHFVLHPATRKRLIKEDLLEHLQAIPGIILAPRLGYGEFLRLAAGAACVLTDGGSNQEELAALGVPTIVMRKATERLDGLNANALMESDVSGGVRDYLLTGKFVNLAMPSVSTEGEGPSERIARFLGNGDVGMVDLG